MSTRKLCRCGKARWWPITKLVGAGWIRQPDGSWVCDYCVQVAVDYWINRAVKP